MRGNKSVPFFAFSSPFSGPALSRTREHRERAHRLAQRSYELGEANLSEVLDAQRGALQARQRALEGRAALATA